MATKGTIGVDPSKGYKTPETSWTNNLEHWIDDFFISNMSTGVVKYYTLIAASIVLVYRLGGISTALYVAWFWSAWTLLFFNYNFGLMVLQLVIVWATYFGCKRYDRDGKIF